MEEALFLTHFARRVTVVHRRDQLRASHYMQEKARENEKVDFIWNSTVEDVLDDGTNVVTGVMLRDVKTGRTERHDCQGLFLGIGHRPNTEIFRGQLELDEKGYIMTQPGSTATSAEGVFACGDVQDHVYRQAVTAAGTGCMAAIDVERYLGRLEGG